MPTAYFIAGCNGAGKTTFAMEFLPAEAGCLEFVNADLIAKGLSPFEPERAAIAAGRIALKRVAALMASRSDFAIETTLSGVAHLHLIHQLREAGYEVVLFYVWISSANLARERIRDRVEGGGHNIPDADVERRYGRSLSNFLLRYVGLADVAAILDNTGRRPVLVAERRNARWTVADEALFAHIRSQVIE